MPHSRLVQTLTGPGGQKLQEPVWEEVKLPDGRVFSLVFAATSGSSRVPRIVVAAQGAGASVIDVEDEEALPAAIESGRPLLPKVLASLGHATEAQAVAEGVYEGHDFLASAAFGNATACIVHRLHVHDETVACELEVKIAGERPQRRPLLAKDVAGAVRAGLDLFELAFEKHPDLVDLLVGAESSLLAAHQWDMAAEASDGRELPSGKSPSL